MPTISMFYGIVIYSTSLMTNATNSRISTRDTKARKLLFRFSMEHSCQGAFL